MTSASGCLGRGSERFSEKLRHTRCPLEEPTRPSVVESIVGAIIQTDSNHRKTSPNDLGDIARSQREDHERLNSTNSVNETIRPHDEKARPMGATGIGCHGAKLTG